MCYADSSAAQCLDCLALAPVWITTLCRGSRNASAMHRACLLRYSDTHFLGISTNRAVIWAFLPYATGMDTMVAARSRVMEELVKKAGDLPLRLYNYSIPYTDPLLGTDVVSGLAQCTRDLAPSKCGRCISMYTAWAWRLLPNNSGGVIKGYNCYLRYKLGALNITLPPQRTPPTPVPRITDSELPPSTPPMPPRLVVGLSVGSASFLVILGLGIFIRLFVWRRRNRSKIFEEGDVFDDELAMEDDFEKGTGPK
ncbi:hypothetical protein ACQ4PT_066693 [Festuca glaucescens]